LAEDCVQWQAVVSNLFFVIRELVYSASSSIHKGLSEGIIAVYWEGRRERVKLKKQVAVYFHAKS
jgi:hypothetical protein